MFIIWCPTSDRPPRYRHASYHSALDEAKRLASMNPNREFIVMRARSSVKCTDPFHIENYSQDDIPF